MKYTSIFGLIAAGLAGFAAVLAIAAYTDSSAKSTVTTVVLSNKATVPKRTVPKTTTPTLTVPKKTTQERELFPFALTFRDTVNAASRENGGPLIRKVTCLQGDVGHYFCAYLVTNPETHEVECRGASIDYREGEIVPQRAANGQPIVGQLPLTPDKCTARQAFRRVFKG